METAKRRFTACHSFPMEEITSPVTMTMKSLSMTRQTERGAAPQTPISALAWGVSGLGAKVGIFLHQSYNASLTKIPLEHVKVVRARFLLAMIVNKASIAQTMLLKLMLRDVF